jgi:hypothetical protein
MPLRPRGFGIMARSTIIAALIAVVGVLTPLGQVAASAACTREDFAKAVDRAGAALRKLNAENGPRLQAKMRQLKTKMGWSDVGYEAKALQAVQDERIAALDAQANERLARIDTLGTIDPTGEPDCARLDELSATNLELQATLKAKTSYLLMRLDQMLSDNPVPKLQPQPQPQPQPKAKVAGPAPSPPPPPASKPPQSVKVEPPAKAPAEPQRDIVVVAPSDTATPRPPGPPLPPDEEGYTIDEIRAVSAGFFGQLSANLAAVIEHAFRKSGRPTGYVLGTEGGGAFLAGVRYGKGTLYLRSGGTQPVFWHGPSLGADVGGEGSKTLFLIYKLREPEQLFSTFTGVDGSAYLVGGVGATLVTNGKVIMAPIRSGLGLRLGANIGYIRFTPRATWNPF